MQIFDLHTVMVIVLVAVAGGIIGLDRTAAGQFMISQPVVAGPLTGWLLGDPVAGTVIGVVLELLWVLDMPVGTFVPADATIGTVSATAIASLGSAGTASLDLVGFTILLSVLMVPIIMMTDEFVRKRNSNLVEKAFTAAQKDLACRLSWYHLSGLGVFFLKSFVLYLLLIPAGLAALTLFHHLPPPVQNSMALFVKLLPLLGAAVVLNKLSIAVLDRFLVIGFSAAVVLSVLLGSHPLIIILLVITTGIAGAVYRERRS